MAKKTLSEQETRKNILEYSRMLGCEEEVKQIFSKYDNLLRGCTNAQERDAIATMGVLEIHRYVTSTPGEIVVGGKVLK